jgi:MFS family permease
MTTLYALFTEKRFGYDAHANGYLFGYIGILSAVVQGGLIGRLIVRFGETVLARIGLVITTASMAALPFSRGLGMLLLVSAGLAIGSGFASPTLSGLASKMIDPSWQGRALGVLQAAGSLARLVGPLLGGWLLMRDLARPISEYARTPFFVGAVISAVAVLVAFCVRQPAGARSVEPRPIEADV